MADQEDIGVLLSKIAVDVADLKKGLQEGRNELTSFRSMAADVGASVKKALTFAGISLGLYEVLSQIKEFGREAIDTGARVESLRLSAYAFGENLGASAPFIDSWVERLKKVPMSAETAWRTVIAAFKSGLPLTEIEKLSRAVANIAPLARMSMDEAMSAILRTVQTGSPLALRSLELPAKLLQQLEQQAGNDVEAMVGRFKTISDFLIGYAATMEGVALRTGDGYLKQLAKVARAAEEAKTALYDNFLLPIAQAVTGEKLKGWQDLYSWINKNKDRLQELGTGIGVVISRLISMVEFIGKVIALHPEWAGILVSIWAGYKLIAMALGPLGGIAKIFTGAQTTGAALLIILAKLRLALAGLVASPWAIVITLGVVAAVAGASKLKEQLSKPGSGAAAAGMALGEAWTPEKGAEYAEAHEELIKGKAPPAEKKENPEPSDIDLNKQADDIAKKQQQNLKDLMKKLGSPAGGGGAGAKDNEYAKQVQEYLKMVETIRQADLKSAESGLEILKASHANRKAELDQQLAEGLIDGQTYYDRLKEMEDGETAAALALIDKKKQAQFQAHQDALKGLALEDVSPEVKAYRSYDLDLKNRAEMAKLDADATKTKLEGEKRVTEELTKQFERTKQIKEKTEDLQLGTAWGPIEEQEAAIQKLILDWARAKAEALKTLGAANPEYAAYVAAGEAKLQVDIQKARYGDQISGMASAITSGFSSIIDAMMSGGQDLMKSANSMFKSIFTESLKPGLKALTQLLTDGFKELFGAAGSAIGSAIMGVIGLIGMLLTSGGSKSSFTSSGVQSAVTGHEAVRGIIAGETSIPIAQIGDSLKDALVETNGILLAIEGNTRGSRSGAGGPLDVRVTIQGIEEAVNAAMERYFQNYLMLGARS